MGTEFTPIFLYVLVAIAIAGGSLLLGALIGPKKRTSVKLMPYESGMDPVGDARQRFDIRFYLVAIVFLLFDVELLFLYPWAVGQWSVPDAASVTVAAVPAGSVAVAGPAVIAAVVPQPGVPPDARWIVFGAMIVLVVLLTLADVYAWKKGVFSWR